MAFFGGLTRKKLFSSASASASAERRKKEEDYYLKNGSVVLEELLALCDGNCRIPIRYFSAVEIERAIKHSETKMGFPDVYMVTGSLDNRPVLVRFDRFKFTNIHRDIAITAQMSHLKNVLRLIGCCLEFEEPVMVYEYVEAITTLSDLLFREGDHKTRKSLSWGNRLRIASEVASAIVFLHTEFTTPIIHRDIKPSKVIINQNSGVAKIVDFSYCISLPPGELEAKADFLLGTYWYVDPKYAISGIVTQKTDVYSFGVLLFQLLTRKEVYDIEQTIRQNVMNRMDSATSEGTLDFEEGAEFNIEENNVMNRVNTILKETTEFEEYVKFNTEEGNVMDKVKATIYFDIEEDNVMHRVDSTISEKTIYFDIEEDNAMDRVDSTVLKETIDIKENAISNTEEGIAMDRLDYVILKETIDFKNLPTNFVNRYIGEGNVIDIADPTIIEEHGIEIQQQLEDYLDLVKKCTSSKVDDRPYIIHVARELRRMEKCFHALTLGQS